MLSKRYRLTSNSAFIATYNQKHSVANKFFVLYAGKEKTDQTFNTRAGFVVSKKISKRAVKRNRIKRLLRESFRRIQQENEINWQKHISYIFVARNASLELNFKDTLEEMKNLFKRLLK